MLLLLGAGLLAFARSWVDGDDLPGVAYVWPAAVLVLLGVTSLAESYLLHGAGLMLFVTVCRGRRAPTLVARAAPRLEERPHP